MAQREEGRREKMGSIDLNLARKQQRKARLEARRNQRRLAHQKDLEMTYSLPCTSHKASSQVGQQTTPLSKRKAVEMSLSSEESEGKLDLVNVPKYVELERPTLHLSQNRGWQAPQMLIKKSQSQLSYH